jgi:eukaryotic-like serine/threonine-protein kinase
MRVMQTPRPDVFLSYSREDQATARRFAEALEREGFKVWWDQALSTGDTYDSVTEKALDEARAVVVLWSKKSVSSRWVRAEATTADRNGVLMPVMIEDCRRPILFELMQTAELSNWKGDVNDPPWRAFIGDLRRLVLRGQGPEAAVVLERAAQQASATGTITGTPVPMAAAVSRGRPLLLASVAVAVVAAVGAGVWGWQRAGRAKQAREAVPAIAELVDRGDFKTAFARAQEVRRYAPEDSLLKSLTPLFTAAYSIESTPAGVDVSVRSHDDPEGQWQKVGSTPLERVELPRGAQRWRFEKEGLATVERAYSQLADQGLGPFLADGAGKLSVALKPAGEQPDGMVLVLGGTPQFARVPPVSLPDFYMDRLEVSNADYKEFVDAGGYERRSWWEGLDLRKDGEVISFEEAMRLFVDATGRPGPANWELGSFPEGAGDHPVSGVSWYEAMAYARFRGKSLPTIYHWARAAFLDDEVASSLAALTAPLSNFGTTGAAATGRYQGMGPYGTYDLFGNVREWLLNSSAVGGWVIGGSWQDPMYSYSSSASLPRLERSGLNGFRLVKDITEPENRPALNADVDLGFSDRRDPSTMVPVSDEVYASFLRQFAYSTGPLNASEAVTMATTDDWIKQRVTIDAGYNGERMDVILFVPRRARPPFQPIILFSGIQIFQFPDKLENIEPGFSALPLDYVVKSGRMLVQPVFQGSYERFKSRRARGDSVRAMSEFIEWRWDLGKTLDYLATRPDVDSTRIGYVGLSMGASTAVPLLAVEPRIKAAVLQSGGVPSEAFPPLMDVVNHAPRVRIPVLMFNGRWDEIMPIAKSQEPLFRLLGSPAADKRHVLYDFGHGSPPRGEVLRETLGWYDKYLGPVAR